MNIPEQNELTPVVISHPERHLLGSVNNALSQDGHFVLFHFLYVCFVPVVVTFSWIQNSLHSKRKFLRLRLSVRVLLRVQTDLALFSANTNTPNPSHSPSIPTKAPEGVSKRKSKGYLWQGIEMWQRNPLHQSLQGLSCIEPPKRRGWFSAKVKIQKLNNALVSRTSSHCQVCLSTKACHQVQTSNKGPNTNLWWPFLIVRTSL